MTRLRDIVRPSFLTTVQPEASVAEAVRLMTERNVGIVAVLRGDILIGLCSERDVVRRVVGHGLDPRTTRVQDVMTSEIVVADADEDHQAAMATMDSANIRHLPVVSDGRLLGMLSIRDMLRMELSDKGDQLRFLHEYLYQSSPDIVMARP